MKIPQRARSRRAWAATIALALFVLKTYFRIEIPQADTLISMIFLTGAAWGIWIDP